MHIISGQIHKERLILILVNKFQGMSRYGIRNILILPQSFSSPFHITDTADAVHNGLIMSMRGFQIIQQFRMVFSQRFTGERFRIAHLYRSTRIIVGHHTVLNKNTRHTVARSSHNIGIVKT